MDNSIAFYIGSLGITWYSIFVFFGLVTSATATYLEWKRRNLPMKIYGWLFISVTLFGFFGARWFYLIFNPSDIYGAGAFFSLSGGRSIIGGVVFGSIFTSIIISIGKLEIDRREIFSIILPNMLLAQAFGRWGNFTSQEVYGLAVDNLNHLPTFIQEGMYIEVDGVYNYYQPLFLYESILNLLGWLLITFIAKPNKKLKPGTHGSLYLIWYGIVRSSMELYRSPQFIMNINGFPTSFFWAIIFIVVGIISFVVFQWYYGYFEYYKDEVFKYKFIIFYRNIINMKYFFNFRSSTYIKNKKEINMYYNKKIVDNRFKKSYYLKAEEDNYYVR